MSPKNMFVAQILLISIWLLPDSRALRAHEGHEGHAKPAQSTSTAKDGDETLVVARGVVFEDLNANGKRDPGEQGLADVRVSNGEQIVATDNAGNYQLSISDVDSVVFVIKPSGWTPPLNEQKLPQFFYIHKPNGSPASYQYAGVAPTGPLPESVDFAMTRQAEPNRFKALLFGDPQPRDIREVEYIEHDVVEQIISEHGHDAAFGVTLGDIAFDNLETLEPLNRAIALIGIPWYNVIGNHDLNQEAVDDRGSDETFERVYGPSYYAFDYGTTHFLVLDDVTWFGATDKEKAHYRGGLGERQLQFIRNDLATIPEDQLIVLMMHIPLTDVQDRQDLYRIIEQRPAAVSISAHAHYMEHRYIGNEDGWQGPERHHHIVNVTVCGSWWRGQPDERGIPHATMSDGGPNGYSIMEFDGNRYSLEFRAASRPASYQMNIYAPEVLTQQTLVSTVVLANVFAASDRTQCELRVDDSPWATMERLTIVDPNFLAEKAREEALTNRDWISLPSPHPTPHFYRAMLPADIAPGTHQIEIRTRDPQRPETTGTRIFRME